MSAPVSRWSVANTLLDDLVGHQLIGSMNTRHRFAAESCATEIARRLAAGCLILQAPAVAFVDDLAAGLRREPVMAKPLQQLEIPTKALFSVSDVSGTTTLVSAGIVKPRMWHGIATAARLTCWWPSSSTGRTR